MSRWKPSGHLRDSPCAACSDPSCGRLPGLSDVGGCLGTRASDRPQHRNVGGAVRDRQDPESVQPTETGSAARTRGERTSAPFRFFSPKSFWNTPLQPRAPVASNSRALVADLIRYVKREQAGKYGPWINATSDGVTILTVPANQPTVTVTLDHYPDANLSFAWSAVPLPPGARPSPGDNDLAVWQPSTDSMWEFFQLHQTANGWEAEWGGAMQERLDEPWGVRPWRLAGIAPTGDGAAAASPGPATRVDGG